MCWITSWIWARCWMKKTFPNLVAGWCCHPWVCGMIKKSELKDASLAGDGTSIVRNGRLGIIDRFTLYCSNNLANAAGVTQCLAGVKGLCRVCLAVYQA